jgi:Carbohydrate family 9 binding domain-like/Concanavalin A-like lectin/glucanases superfamily/Tetratricopeptide repeat
MKIIAKLTLCLLLAAMAPAARAASAGELLQQGLYAEEVDGNINAAIKIYGQIIASSSAAPNQVAQALYRQGMCYVKLKDDASARTALEKLVNDYPSQTDLVEKARPVLDDLTDFDPAALMPPGTLVYVEFGSPGRQVETVLSMLKGTPFENPLAAIGGNNRSNGGQKNPGDIVGALLNPSMMAEFKKIRGSAFGITGLPQRNSPDARAFSPPCVYVLYPGQSDALRGIILAAFGMAGSPGDPIDGMQTIHFQNGGVAAAYDDKVIIVAQPLSQLEWCVKQYKHTSSEPTLASTRGSFQKLDKTQRQKNAMTVWADAAGVYSGLLTMMPPGNVPPGLLRANAMLDFTNIDDIIFTESIESNRLGLRASLQFKEGHGCLAYDLIRTPNLSKAALQAVPSDAIALASFSLSPGDALQTEEARAHLQQLTGLDVGREIFANIEQISVFLTPAGNDEAPQPMPEIVIGHLGVAITSHDPARTRQLLTTILGAMFPGEGDPNAGRFKIGHNNDQDLDCYLQQVGGITLLSLNHDTLAASANAITRHASVCDTGPMRDAVDRITPATSKLILANAGGAMRLIGPQVNTNGLDPAKLKQLNDSFEQIARAADATTLQVRTDEQPDSLALGAEVSGIPPLNEVVGPATQFAQIREQARAESESRHLRQQAAATIAPLSHPLNLGAGEAWWQAAPSYKLENVVVQSPSGTHATAEFRGLYDDKNLYLQVDVTDSTLHHDTNAAKYDTDGIEIYLDATDAKSAEFTDTDYEYDFNWDPTNPEMQEYKHNRTNGVQYAMVTTDNGYRLEVAFPWSTLGTKPAAGARIGLDVHVNDNQGHGKRDAKISWHDEKDHAWQNPQAFGNAELGGLIGCWKFDETHGTVARDSSGGGNHDGTLIGNAHWAPGRIGGAVALDGKGSYVEIANKQDFDFSGQLTLSAWVNIHSVTSPWMAIITKGDSAWRLSTYDSDRKIHFSVNHYDHTDGVNGSTALNPNEWHHLTAVYDGETMKLYVDGKIDATTPWTRGISRNDADVLIGENADHRGRGFNGLIDDVRIYNYALPESEIRRLATGQ